MTSQILSILSDFTQTVPSFQSLFKSLNLKTVLFVVRVMRDTSNSTADTCNNCAKCGKGSKFVQMKLIT